MSNTKEHNIELKGNCIVDTKFADAGIILRTMSNTSSLNNELNVKCIVDTKLVNIGTQRNNKNQSPNEEVKGTLV